MGKRRKRIKLHEVSLEEDIKYRGPLSYRHFRIFGWLCIALSQVVMLIGIIRLPKGFPGKLFTWRHEPAFKPAIN